VTDKPVVPNVQRAVELFGRRRYVHTYCSVYSRCCATAERWENILTLFLGNGSVNTFPLLGSRFLIMQQLDYNSGRAVFTAWSVPR
jgi:hypothetical protein